MTEDQAFPIEIDCQAVHSLRREAADFLLLDCREPAEFERVRIEGTTLIPMSELGRRAAELLEHKQRRIVVYCHLGGRSLRVAQWLREQGYVQAQSMAGGIDEWAKSVDPELPTY